MFAQHSGSGSPTAENRGATRCYAPPRPAKLSLPPRPTVTATESVSVLGTSGAEDFKSRLRIQSRLPTLSEFGVLYLKAGVLLPH